MNNSMLLEITFALLSLKRVNLKGKFCFKKCLNSDNSPKPNCQQTPKLVRSLTTIESKSNQQERNPKFQIQEQQTNNGNDQLFLNIALPEALENKCFGDPRQKKVKTTNTATKLPSEPNREPEIILDDKTKKLAEFLQKKPKPSWFHRLQMFYDYNPSLIVGWGKDIGSRTQLKRAGKSIIINKELFYLASVLSENTKNPLTIDRIYKSSQRGVEVFLKKQGYHRIQKYSRSTLSFEIIK
ncbi:hypothetical protein M0812_15040 [Anaeramoeba flamelloides]|uniref:Uncharacterized protein n=1 Tax=Anaeramoeba flamelloides TaxID=1746091 RepID=A0AAV7ZCW9_9EUKA|nr:hypothetical protein M0812_15040 [Anaeramoeba flamelloides]